MAQFLSKSELYPLIIEKSAKTRNILWVCSPYVGDKAHEIFSQKIVETPPNDIRFIFKLNRQSVRRGEVNPYEIEYLNDHFRNGIVRTNDTFHAKVYIFDDSALVTSANLSRTAFERNIEAGVLLEGKQVRKVKGFFEELWKNSKPEETG